MKLFRNFVTYFNVIWVICGEITYTSNIFEIDPLIYFKDFSKLIFLNFEIYRTHGHWNHIVISSNFVTV